MIRPVDSVIRTDGLTHRYGKMTALDDVQLRVPRGSLYALLGPNGAGKSTLMKILLGLIRPTSGSVEINGRPVESLRARDRQWLAYVAEGQELPDWMTLEQLERFSAPLYPRWDFALADQLRARFRLPRNRRIKKMSRGEKMKAALLTALAPRPEVLVMDEPFTGMDALVKHELVQGLLELAEEQAWTVFVCSHDIGELEMLADWVGFLDRGKLILSEPTEVLRDRFRRVEVRLDAEPMIEMETLPPTWLSPKRAGHRLEFVTSDHGSNGWEREVQGHLLGSRSIEARPTSLKEVFVALAAEGLGGRDWEQEGGLG
jgi:ABC-type multidrug transport system ATPase subunit